TPSCSLSPPMSACLRRCSYSASTTHSSPTRRDMADKAARTILAFDFGLQRIGVAVGEAELRTAHALQGVAAQTQPGRFTAIERLVAEWKPSLLVVGRPLDE